MFRAWYRVFDYSGRSTRWEYWSFLIGFIIILAITGAWVANYQHTHYGLDPQLSNDDTLGVSVMILGFLALPQIALRVRRYHDFGWSGWATLWVFVPIVNVVMECMLLFRGPTAEPVAYAANSEPQHITIYNSPTAGTAGTSQGFGDHIDQIARLADMHAKGMLTAPEFAAAKAKVLHG